MLLLSAGFQKHRIFISFYKKDNMLKVIKINGVILYR